MQPFLFYVNDGLARTPSFQLEGLDDLEAAIAHARHLLDREARYKRITIVFGDEELARIERP
jgi:hypothetical protein